MTKSFDEWINENGFNFRPEQYDLYKYLYEASQQSKQAEVDELQKRIDEALHEADESCGVSVDAFVKLNKILKGNANDH